MHIYLIVVVKIAKAEIESVTDCPVSRQALKKENWNAHKTHPWRRTFSNKSIIDILSFVFYIIKYHGYTFSL